MGLLPDVRATNSENGVAMPVLRQHIPRGRTANKHTADRAHPAQCSVARRAAQLDEREDRGGQGNDPNQHADRP